MSAEPETTGTAPIAKRSWAQRHRLALMVGGPLLLAVAGGALYLTGGRYVSTDDAYIQAGRVAVSANIAGQVTEVDVHDNEPVKKGAVLFRLDQRPLQIAVEDAKAKLQGSMLDIQALKAEYQQRVADLTAARDTLAYRQREMERQRKLAAAGISSQAQLDQARNAMQSATQGVESAQQVINSVLAKLGGNADLPVAQAPSVQAAQAMLDRADLNLSYGTVSASIDGIVTKVEQLQVGDYINAAAPVFTLVSTRNVYIEGNFKETDLAYMKPGQKATFRIDAYPGHVFSGRVASTSPGTGSSFSLLPPENASGNWVKVVQRVPVRISIDRDDSAIPLNPGLSVTVTVDTEHRRSL